MSETMVNHRFLVTSINQFDDEYRKDVQSVFFDSFFSLVGGEPFVTEGTAVVFSDTFDCQLKKMESVLVFMRWFFYFISFERYCIAKVPTRMWFSFGLSHSLLRLMGQKNKLYSRVRFSGVFRFLSPLCFNRFVFRGLNRLNLVFMSGSEKKIWMMYRHYLSYLYLNSFVRFDSSQTDFCMLEVLFSLAVCLRCGRKEYLGKDHYWVNRFIKDTDVFFVGAIRNKSNDLDSVSKLFSKDESLFNSVFSRLFLENILSAKNAQDLYELLGHMLCQLSDNTDWDVFYLSDDEVSVIKGLNRPYLFSVEQSSFYRYWSEGKYHDGGVDASFFDCLNIQNDFSVIDLLVSDSNEPNRKVLLFSFEFQGSCQYVVSVCLAEKSTFFLGSKFDHLKQVVSLWMVHFHFLFQFCLLKEHKYGVAMDDYLQLERNNDVPLNNEVGYNYSMGFVAHHIFHEINNPLATMVSGFECLESSDLPFEDDSMFKDNICQNVNRIKSLTNVFMKLDRYHSLKDQNLSVNDLIDDLLLIQKKVIHEKGVEIVSDYSYLSPISGVYYILAQILSAALLNAIEASQSDGQVTIETFGHLMAEKNTPVISIRIVDEGCGIAPETLDCVFMPFFTTKPDHLGLGLTQVLGWVTKCGYFIDLNSENGKTIFVLTIPI